MLRNIKLIVAYDGEGFFGWQQTKMGPSVEEALNLALKRLLNEPYRCEGCSRTDAGVHAIYQVVRIFTRKTIPLSKLKKGLNALLPEKIRLLDLEEMALSFHPTLDSTGKEYSYSLCLVQVQLPFLRGFSWHVGPLDVEKMEQASSAFLGRHDFTALCNMRKDLRYEDKFREISSIQFEYPEEKRLLIRIRANHFLYKMARNIVGTLVYVGKGKIECCKIREILEAKKRAQAGITAPAHGLTLTQVFYPPKILQEM